MGKQITKIMNMKEFKIDLIKAPLVEATQFAVLIVLHCFELL